MFVVISQFAVANGMEEAVRVGFLNRPHEVDSVPGFVRMEVMRPQNEPNVFWLVTFWTDEPAFRAWHGSHQYHTSHRGIPDGLKLIPQSTQIRCFEHLCS